MSHNDESSWDACPEGTIGSMVRHQVTQRRVRDMKIYGGVLAVVLVVGISVVATQIPWTSTGTGVYKGGLWCNEVADNLVDYSEGNLQGDLADKMAIHLTECEHCAEKYNELKASDETVALVTVD